MKYRFFAGLSQDEMEKLLYEYSTWTVYQMGHAGDGFWILFARSDNS